MTPDLLIRLATAADIPAITEIYAHHVAHGTATFETEAPDSGEIARRLSAVEQDGWPWLVCEAEHGIVAGYAYASAYRPRAAYRFTVEDSIYLRPEYASKGIGSALLKRLIELSEAGGARQMIGIIGDSANLASIRLHARFGFRQVGVFQAVGFKFGRWLDTVLVQRALGPGNSSLPNGS